MKIAAFLFSVFSLLVVDAEERHFSFSDDTDWDSPLQLAYEWDSTPNHPETLGDPDSVVALSDELKPTAK